MRVYTISFAMLCAVWFPTTANAQEKSKEAGVKVGDSAPTFESTDDQGKTWKSTDHVGKKIVVVYFYPASLTSGCTKQACGFRDDMKKFSAKNVEVVGVSGDAVTNQQLFKKTHNLNFTLLADEDGAVAKKLGIPTGKGGEFKYDNQALKRGVTAERWTVVIGKDGKIIHKELVRNPAGDSKRVMEIIEKQTP
jgi:peroxiredoxin Q/BCP